MFKLQDVYKHLKTRERLKPLVFQFFYGLSDKALHGSHPPQVSGEDVRGEIHQGYDV